jgi:hypothetical protein
MLYVFFCNCFCCRCCCVQVLRIVTVAGENSKGGFFPNGVNGRINSNAGYTDAANAHGGYPGNQVRCHKQTLIFSLLFLLFGKNTQMQRLPMMDTPATRCGALAAASQVKVKSVRLSNCSEICCIECCQQRSKMGNPHMFASLLMSRLLLQIRTLLLLLPPPLQVVVRSLAEGGKTCLLYNIPPSTIMPRA